MGNILFMTLCKTWLSLHPGAPAARCTCTTLEVGLNLLPIYYMKQKFHKDIINVIKQLCYYLVQHLSFKNLVIFI